MSTYIKDWPCCGSVTETEGYEPDCCPFCETYTRSEVKEMLNKISSTVPDNLSDDMARDVADLVLGEICDILESLGS